MARNTTPKTIELPDKNEPTGVRPFARYIPAGTITRRTQELGAKIGEDYTNRGLSEIRMITIAVGGMFWSVRLAQAIEEQTPDLYVTHDIVRLGSYNAGARSSGSVRDYGSLGKSVADANLLIVDKVVETGSTLSFLLGRLAKGSLDQITNTWVPPASVAVAALVDKADVHNGRVEVNYPGIVVPGNPWLVGCGMDDGEGHGRTLPAVHQSARPQDVLAQGYNAAPQTIPPTFRQVA